MKLRFIPVATALAFGSLVLAGCSAQTTRARAAVSASHLSCAPGDVEVDEQTESTWAASCNGKRVKCTAHGSDNQCAADPPETASAAKAPPSVVPPATPPAWDKPLPGGW